MWLLSRNLSFIVSSVNFYYFDLVVLAVFIKTVNYVVFQLFSHLHRLLIMVFIVTSMARVNFISFEGQVHCFSLFLNVKLDYQATNQMNSNCLSRKSDRFGFYYVPLTLI